MYTLQTIPDSNNFVFLQNTKALINRKLDEVIHFAYEPQLMSDDCEPKDSDGIVPSYIYRMKAIDAFHFIGMIVVLVYHVYILPFLYYHDQCYIMTMPCGCLK